MDSQLDRSCSPVTALIGGIWFDGVWEHPEADWRLDKTYSLIHKLQPSPALIGNNHHVPPFPGEDFQMFEKGLPGRGPVQQRLGDLRASARNLRHDQRVELGL